MTNAAIGTAGLTLAFASSLLGIVTLIVGISGRRPQFRRMAATYVWLVVAGALTMTFAMQRALLTDDFTMRYVHDNSSTQTPLMFKVSTMWSALEGSIILWALILAGYLALVTLKLRRRLSERLVSWVLLTMFAVSAFFFALMLGPANPFQTVANVPAGFDGPGPNPLLQNHPLMAFHPPMLYLGYVGFTVPFAFAVAALVTGRVGEGWLLETRRWTLFAWGFLTVGIVLGSWWSYEVLGWGGYWAWDPVENASFLPWLTGTAYLHSVMVQERRGMLRVWNLSLLCATFSLTILGTFLTRSGVLDSVHSFTASGIGPMLLGFFAVIVLVSVALIGWRGDRLRSPGRIDSAISREGAFLANNIVFAAFAFVVLLGTVFPLIVEAVNQDRLSVGVPYFSRMTMPIGFTLLFLMAVAPVLPWRKANAELLRFRLLYPAAFGVLCMVGALALGGRGALPLLAFGMAGFAAGSAFRQLTLAMRTQGWRGLVGRANGGMIVHLGVIIIAVAFAASSAYIRQTELTLTNGQTGEFAGHTFRYTGTTQRTYPNRVAIEAGVEVDGKLFAPALSRFDSGRNQIGTPSVATTPLSDVALSLLELPDSDAAPVTVRVTVQPLIMWLWIGGGVMALGTVLCAFPGRRRLPTDPVSSAPGDRRASDGEMVGAPEAVEDNSDGVAQPVGVTCWRVT